MGDNNKFKRTTKRDFRIFQEEVEKWLSFFGLSGWNIDFLHKKLPSHELACITYDLNGKNINFFLTTTYRAEYYNEKSIRETARHEVLECLLARLDFLAKDRFTTEEQIDEARHEIIAILENTMFKFFKNYKQNE
jgi:hypothetical protein